MPTHLTLCFCRSFLLCQLRRLASSPADRSPFLCLHNQALKAILESGHVEVDQIALLEPGQLKVG